jgi:hypothetical protein
MILMAYNGQSRAEKLAQTLKRLLKTPFMLFVAVWVPISIPMTCQIHGLMLHMPTNQSSHHISGMSTDSMNETTADQLQIVPTHRPLANSMMLMQLMIMLTPSLNILSAALGRESLLLHDAVFPLARTVTPPNPPPRNVSF